MPAHEMLAAQIELVMICDRLLQEIDADHPAYDAIAYDYLQASKRVERYSKMVLVGRT